MKIHLVFKSTSNIRFSAFWVLGLQVVEDGYEFFSYKKLVTVFSAPNYCGEFNNAGVPTDTLTKSKPLAMSCNNLPMDITQAILSLLPAKSLGRFKSVSKRWESLISDPQFIKTHLLQSNDCHKTRKLTMLSDTKSLYSVDISELGSLYSDDLSATGKEVGFGSSPIKWKEMWGSCNGLVLAEDENGMIYLMNPTTQELWKVPPSPFALPDEESFVMYGFGYDMSTDDYKVISMSIWDPFRDHDTDTDMFVSVYSLRSNSWRKLPNFPYGDDTPYLMRGVLIHQNLHCFTMNSGGCSKIAVFSLADEEFNVIKLPDSTEGVFFDTLVDLGGKLGASGDIWGAGSELWVMEEYGIVESWTRVCIYGYETRNVLPVCLVKGSNRDIVSHNLGEVVVYNIDERRCTNVRIIGVPSSRFKIGGTYVETLESPKRIITPP